MKIKMGWMRAVRTLVAAVASVAVACGQAGGVPTPRLVPVDPLLSEVDAPSGQMTFY